MRVTEPDEPPGFTLPIPSFLGFLERMARITDPRQFSFNLISAIDELLLPFKPGCSFLLSENECRLIRHFAHHAFEAGRPLQLQHCGPQVLNRGLRALIGLVDILTLPEEERNGHRSRERSFMTTVKWLQHAAYAAQLAVDEEWIGGDVDLPPLSGRLELVGRRDEESATGWWRRFETDSLTI
jgi:hypothetical protein